jgi:hypothetical protein
MDEPSLPRGIRVERKLPAPQAASGYREPQSPEPPRGELVVRRRWFRWIALFLTVFCVLWDTVIISFFVALPAGGPLVARAFPLIHAAVGAALTYWTLALYVNSTVLRIADGRLTIRHRPLPWFRNHDLPVDSFKQLFVRRRTRRRKGREIHTYEVILDSEDDPYLKLLTGLPRRDQAEYIEWAIEDFLGIANDSSR